MNKKLIFFDIDGTILSHRTHQISASTKSAIRKARDNGHLVFINTGRTLAEIESKIIEVGFDGLICGCGTYISFHGEVLLHNIISSDLTKRMIEDLRKYHIDAILEGTDALYYDTTISYPWLQKHRDRQLQEFHFNVLTMDAPEVVIDKFCIFPDNDQVYAMFYEKYKEDFDFIDREGRLYEIVPKGYSKASGIEFLLSHLNLSWEDTYALGDGANDLPMLTYVKHSIGMGNSDSDLHRIVSFLTKDVDQDGIEYALKHYNII